MISDGESQMPLLQFLLRGGGSVHRLDSDESQYLIFIGTFEKRAPDLLENTIVKLRSLYVR